MQPESYHRAVADLAEAAAIQTAVAHDRLTLEWAQIVMTRLLNLWKRLEVHETLAYEDKVAAQVRMLEEATSSLWYLHKSLVQTTRRLKAHQQQLKRNTAAALS
jgi:hypothetical protein